MIKYDFFRLKKLCAYLRSSYSSAPSAFYALPLSSYTFFIIIFTITCNVQAVLWPFGKNGKSDILKPAENYFRQGNHSKAIETINDLLQRRLSAEDQINAYWHLGKSYELSGKPDKALSIYQLASNLYPEEIKFLLALAKVYYDAELTERAKIIFEEALERDPENSQAHAGLAESMEKLGFLFMAAGHYRSAIEQSGYNDKNLWHKYARCLYKQRRFVEAENAAKQALDLGAGKTETWLLLAQISFQQGKPQLAVERAEEAEKFSAGRRDILIRKALWQAEAGNTAGAVFILADILQKNQADNLALWTFAIVHIKAGRPAEAALALNKIRGDKSSFIVKTAALMLKDLQ